MSKFSGVCATGRYGYNSTTLPGLGGGIPVEKLGRAKPGTDNFHRKEVMEMLEKGEEEEAFEYVRVLRNANIISEKQSNAYTEIICG
jgi:hypothetical protein